MTDKQSSGLSYKDAGVDIDAGAALVDKIKPFAKRTARPEVLAGLGGFGALFELPVERYRRPVLVSGTDGVGTKLRLALDLNRHDTIGQDLVAMCANDIVVTGAEPLYFLDYYATGRLDVETAATVIRGIAQGCELAGAALAGGETAEMPGMYADEDYDLAGFCVGVVEKDRLLDGHRVKPGDRLLGLASTGPHSNGYSLIRKVLALSGASLDDECDGQSLGDALLAPTRIYVKPILALLQRFEVHAIAHITGGGLTDNLPRVLPDQTQAVIDLHAWPEPAVFQWLAQAGGITREEMLRTFNCGIGMVLVLDATVLEAARFALAEQGIDAWPIGVIESTMQSSPQVSYTA